MWVAINDRSFAMSPKVDTTPLGAASRGAPLVPVPWGPWQDAHSCSKTAAPALIAWTPCGVLVVEATFLTRDRLGFWFNNALRVLLVLATPCGCCPLWPRGRLLFGPPAPYNPHPVMNVMRNKKAVTVLGFLGTPESLPFYSNGILLRSFGRFSAKFFAYTSMCRMETDPDKESLAELHYLAKTMRRDCG